MLACGLRLSLGLTFGLGLGLRLDFRFWLWPGLVLIIIYGINGTDHHPRYVHTNFSIDISDYNKLKICDTVETRRLAKPANMNGL